MDKGTRLPPDILVMIFEELQITGSLRPLRLVSTQFEDLIVPIVVREVELTEQIIAQYLLKKPSQEHTALQRLMGLHTRHVTIRCLLHWASVKNMLATLNNLRSIKWVYWPTQPNPKHMIDPTIFDNNRVFESIRRDWPNLKYSVDGLKAKHIDTWSLGEIPAPVVSCKLIEWRHYYYPRLAQSMKSSLLLNATLEILHISGADNRATIRETDINQHDRLPPIKELSLHQFEWAYSVHAAITFWNWSNLSRLELKGVPILLFLQTVAPKYLVKLEEFTTDGYCRHRSERQEVTDLISTLVLGIRALHKLILTCYIADDKIVSAVSKHGKTLHTLQLCVCHTTRSRRMLDRPDYQPLDERQLERIGQACPHLTTLVVDYMPDIATLPRRQQGIEVLGEDSALTMFRNLRRLTAFACICKWESSPVLTYSEAGNAWLDHIVAAKKGARFESIELEMNVFKSFPNKTHLCLASQNVGFRAE